ncbi:hypothetical protein EMST110833_06650 [Empedobacter stercoris]
MGVLVYDVAVDEEVRSGIKTQFKEIRTQVGENPKEFFPILGEVALTVLSGNSLEEWKTTVSGTDAGVRSHFSTRGIGNTIITAVSGAAFVKDLPEIADKLGDAVKKVKKISKTLDDFIVKTLPEKLEDITNIWKTKYPIPDMLGGRTLFEDIMGHYHYKKMDGWNHSRDISFNVKGVDFYKGTRQGNNIFANTAVSMKTTIKTDVNEWLKYKSIQDNIKFLREGKSSKGMIDPNNNLTMFIDNAELHIFMQKTNITTELRKIFEKDF